ncbi:MAG TPA: hypothetical protein PLK77_14745 [Pyrinomonadaceae bacterium]|nr:hypothetical protein [Pyrinomonadaceae bacterium]
MNKPKLRPFLISIAAVLFCGGFSIFSQGSTTAPDQSYEATLYVVIGSDDATHRGDLPKSLDGVAKQIRETFTFKEYRLLNTYYGRLANNGSLDYKSVSSLKNASTELDAPTFLDWQLASFKAELASTGKGALSMQVFRFGARVPIVIAKIAGDDGKGVPVTNYETVGLTLNKLTVSANAPTLIGTISLPRTTGTVFLVMSIKPV